MKITIIGHLPISSGGKQSNGAAIVEWFLATHLKKNQKELQIDFIATDIHKHIQSKEGIFIHGWNFTYIIKQIFSSFPKSINLLLKSIFIGIQFHLNILNTWIKLIYYDNKLKILNPDILHIHNILDYVLIRELKFDKEIKLIMTIHAIAGFDRNIRYYEYYNKMESLLSNDKETFIVFVSKYLQNEWENNYLSKNNATILNGIDKSLFRRLKSKRTSIDQKVHLLSIGSISDRKGQIRVLKAIVKENLQEKIRYSCIGTSNSKYLESINTFAETNSIDFNNLGYLSPKDIVEILQDEDYMILPSSSEGYGLVFTESILCGTKIILPKDLPIVNEPNIINEFNSILLDDSSENSIRKILKTLEIRYDREDLTIHTNIPGWDDVAMQYLNLYKKIITNT